MPRKRNGFVPLGDVAEAVELPGDRALTHRAVTPPARRHFTQLDQVTHLVGASEADAELGFMARMLALCSLPRTNPSNRVRYVRRNGPYTLVMTTTVAWLVPPLLLASLPACATRSHRSSMPAVSAEAQAVARTLSDWSRVEAVPVGTQTEVQLHDDAAPPDSRRVTGRLHEVTADTLTLTLGRSTRTRTLAQSDVHIVQIHRPIRNRYAGWLTLVGVVSGVVAILVQSDDLDSFGPRPARVARDHAMGMLLLAALGGVSASVPGFLSQRW